MLFSYLTRSLELFLFVSDLSRLTTKRADHRDRPHTGSRPWNPFETSKNVHVLLCRLKPNLGILPNVESIHTLHINSIRDIRKNNTTKAVKSFQVHRLLYHYWKSRGYILYRMRFHSCVLLYSCVRKKKKILSLSLSLSLSSLNCLLEGHCEVPFTINGYKPVQKEFTFWMRKDKIKGKVVPMLN
jgi:hypothetical protein